MDSIVIALHSLLRWVVLLTGILAVARGFMGGKGKRWTDADSRAGMLFITALDLQFLLGLLLYVFLSPTIRTAFLNFGNAMKDPMLRFFAVEHVTMMLVAAFLVHLGRVLGRKAANPDAKRLRTSICFGLATVLMVLAIPWPGMTSGRPLFRL